jgi:hypothetical protein
MLKPGLATIARLMSRAFMTAQEDSARGRPPDRPDVFSFRPQDVEGIHTHKINEGDGLWFRLHDGRVFDTRGRLSEPQDPACYVEESADNSHDSADGGQHPVSGQDAMDTLPLSIIPLTTQSLKSARLVKNKQMETMVELHGDPLSGSLQIRPEDVGRTFPNSKDDQAIITGLAALKSYDVYSLRTSLKQLGIEVDARALELSSPMKEMLGQYALEFSRPLILNIFGTGSDYLNDPAGHLRKVLRDPDVARVQARLTLMAQTTGIPLAGVPEFLQTYSDLFLSVSYYRYSFERIGPDINRFWLWLADLRNHWEIKASPGALISCRTVEENLRFLCTSIRERQADFRVAFELFLGDMNSKSFERLRQQIAGNYTGLGAVLCGVVVKMRDCPTPSRRTTAAHPPRA